MSTPLRIVIQTSARLETAAMAAVLKEAGYEPEFSYAEGLAAVSGALEGGAPDVIVAEPEVYDVGGVRAVIDAVNAHSPDTPVVLVAKEPDEAFIMRAILAGANDCVPFSEQARLFQAVVRAAREAVRWRDDISLFKTYFRNLFENSSEAIVILDPVEHILDVNDAFVNLFQYEPGEVVGKRISDVIIPEGKQAEYAKLREQVYGGRMIRRETTRQRKDGSAVRVSVIGCPIMFGSNTYGIYAIYSDITRQMKAIQTLRQAESNYRNFFRYALEGMYIATPSGRYMTVNPAMVQLLGYDSTSDLTDNVKSIAKEIYADPDRREEALEVLKEQGRIMGFHSTVRRKDGREIEVCENIRSVRDEDGYLLYYQGTMFSLEEIAASPRC